MSKEIERMIRHKAQELEHVVNVLPTKLGAEAVNFSLQRFRSQNWKGTSRQPWKQRKVKKARGRAILIQSGRLRRSIRILNERKGSVTIGTDVPYAEAHNEGFRGTVTVRAHTRNRYSNVRAKHKERNFTMKQHSDTGSVKAHKRNMNLPQRRFIGDSPALNRQLINRIDLEIKKVL